MSALGRVVRFPSDALEFVNVLLTTDDARIAVTPRDVVWTHRGVTLYRYRSDRRRHAVPLLLVFALVNRPHIFDLRPGNSLTEFLLGEGFDVFLLDWGVPDEEDADTGLDDYVCDTIPWAIRETLRAGDATEVTLLGWCMGATMSAMYCGRKRDDERLPVRNLVLLTMPIDGTDTVYAQLLTAEEFDPEFVAERLRVVPGAGVDFANKLLKPVNNFWTTYRRLWDTVGDRSVRREAYQTMAKWVADNPPFPGRAYAQWVTWLYQDDALLSGRVRLRGRRVDLRRIDEPVLLVTAAGDHIAPRAGTLPFLETISSTDVTHFDRPGGHIGLIAGSAARKEIWPDLAAWLAVRSQPHTNGRPAR